MAEAALLAVTKIGSVLATETSKIIINKVNNLKEMPGKVNQIGMQLRIMSTLIQKIGTVYLTDEVIKSWIGEVRNVAYHVEDVIDRYAYHLHEVEEEGFLKFFIKGPHYANVFSAIADEVNEIEKEIQQVIQIKNQWLQEAQLVPNQMVEMERQRSQDRFPEFVKDEDVVGIEKNRKQLCKWLDSKEPNSGVITVSGMGGLGKSTLVSNVYEREKVKFLVHVWIVVSQVYSPDALLRNLLRKIIGNMKQPLPIGIDKMDLHDLKDEIKKRLENKKCLIVLDDVWEQKVYFLIHDAFQNLQATSRIIITTRKDHVGALAFPTHHLELQPLGKEDAFKLFCRRAFYNKECPTEFNEIANKIVDRCHGLPLAIVTIGSLLSSRPQIGSWKHTYHELQSELLKSDHVRAILNLSYHDLPGDLRNCFLYCSLFPEDYPLSRESLVRMWAAEGFVISKEKNTQDDVVKGNIMELNTREDVAERNLMELIHRNMLEVVEYDELGRVSTFKMHDIMRDLALSVAKDEKFGSADDYSDMIEMDKDVRRLSLWGCKVNTPIKVKFPRLRTFVAQGKLSSSNITSSILSESIHLTVLELQDSDITEVPVSIGNLFNLQYMGLRRTNVKSLPESIEKLSRLQTLDIKQTQIEKLPRGIVKVKKLRHLLADRFADQKQSEFRYFIGVAAPKGLSNLEELQTLETVQASKDLVEQLKKLMQLRSIWIDNVSAADCANLFATLSKMPLLSSLLVSAKDVNETLCLQAFDPDLNSAMLHRLIVRGNWAAGTLDYPIFRNHGKHLKYLALSWCRLGEDPLGVLAPHVPNLTYLSLNRVWSANTLVLSAGCFPHLKTLVLKRMADVKELKIGEGALPCIQGLYIVSLEQLNTVPQGIECLSSLKNLWLLNLHRDFITQWCIDGLYQKTKHVPHVRVQ